MISQHIWFILFHEDRHFFEKLHHLKTLLSVNSFHNMVLVNGHFLTRCAFPGFGTITAIKSTWDIVYELELQCLTTKKYVWERLSIAKKYKDFRGISCCCAEKTETERLSICQPEVQVDLGTSPHSKRGPNTRDYISFLKEVSCYSIRYNT